MVRPAGGASISKWPLLAVITQTRRGGGYIFLVLWFAPTLGWETALAHEALSQTGPELSCLSQATQD